MRTTKQILEEIHIAQLVVDELRSNNELHDNECKIVRDLFSELKESLIKIVKVEITYSDYAIFRNKSFDRLKDFCHYVCGNKPIDFCKIDVLVHYDDGNTLKTKYCLDNYITYSRLINKLLVDCKFTAGLSIPYGMSDIKYKMFQDKISMYAKEVSLNMYYKYQLSDF